MTVRLWLPAAGFGVGAFGAMAMYVADPDQGRRRRAMMRDEVLGVFRAMPRILGRRARGVVAETYAMAQRIQHPRGTPVPYRGSVLPAP
jgi:hypothetical protein